MIGIDYALSPPEVLSVAIETGAQAAGLTPVVAAWEAIAAALELAVTGITETVLSLEGVWQGASSNRMAAAVRSYTAWMMVFSAQVTATATEAGVALSAFEAAVSAMPSSLEVFTNLAERQSLLAVLALAVTAPAVLPLLAENLAQYSQLWVRCSTAMITYDAVASAAMAALPTFTEAPSIANPGGLLDEAAAVAEAVADEADVAANAALKRASSEASEPGLEAADAVSAAAAVEGAAAVGVSAATAASEAPASFTQSLQRVATSAQNGVSKLGSGNFSDFSSMVNNFVAESNTVTSQLSTLQSLASSFSSTMPSATDAATAAGDAIKTAGSLGRGGLGGGAGLGRVGAAMGKAGSIGAGLSVPQAWSAASPAARALSLAGRAAAEGGSSPMMMPPPMMPPMAGAGAGGAGGMGGGSLIKRMFGLPPSGANVMVAHKSGG